VSDRQQKAEVPQPPSAAEPALSALETNLADLRRQSLTIIALIPAVILVIPRFVRFHFVGWLRTPLPLIVPAFFTSA